MKKLFALMLALVMVLVVVSAYGASITITHQDGYEPDDNTTEETYNAYKILDAVVPEGHKIDDSTVGQDIDDTSTGFTYTIAKTSPWYDAVRSCGYFDISVQPDPATADIVTLKADYEPNETTAKAIAAKLEPYTQDKEGSIAPDYSLTIGTAEDVADGYYLIYSTLGENLVLATSDIEIQEKNLFPTLDKTEKDEDIDDYIGAELGTEAKVNVAVGDTIDYQVTVTVPTSADKEITLTDTMSAGLTYNNTITAKIGEDSYDGFTVVSSVDTGWVVTIPADTNTKGKTITFSFSATVNANAVTDEAKKNSVKLEYSNFEQNDSVEYVLNNAGIHKYDGNTNEDLENVEFALKSGDTVLKVSFDETGKYYYLDESGEETLKTDAEGKIAIRGLDADKTYVLEETKPLEGYNKLAAPVDLTLTPDPKGATDPTFIEVENNKGTELPSTGGMGTTIFYVIGGLLIIGAGIVLVARRKAHE